MHILIKRAFVCLFASALFALSACCCADTLEAKGWHDRADPVYRHIQLPPAAIVTSMAQSSDGAMWIGSQQGLLRWDGYRFERLIADPDTPGTLPDNVITLLHRDSAGRLWVGTRSAGLAWLDERTLRFVTIGGGHRERSQVGVFAVADDGAGGLWIGTGAGLEHMTAGGVAFDASAEEQHAAGLPHVLVESLSMDGSGSLWVGTRSGLFRRTAHSNRFEQVALGTGHEANPIVTSLMADSTGRVWIGTHGHGALTIEPGGTKARVVHDTQNADARGLASDTVMTALEVADGEVWLGTGGNGIVRVDTRRWLTYRVRHHDAITSSIADNDIVALFRDRSGLAWVATNTDIGLCNTFQRTVSTWLGYAGNDNGISQSNATSVLATAGHTTWVGLSEGGIDIVNPSTGLYHHLLLATVHIRHYSTVRRRFSG